MRIKRTGFIILISLISRVGYSQFNENFTDGNFTTNPIWIGDLHLFQVNGGVLQSNSLTKATYYLSTPSALATSTEWKFFFDFRFGTSSINLADIYLIADTSDLTAVMNGYFIRIGTTKDEISLYKTVGGIETLLIDGVDGLVNSASSNPFNIRISRSKTNVWKLEYDDGATGSYITEGIVSDSSINTSSFFGIKITQSNAASPIQNHFFDNLSAKSIVSDIKPPEISSAFAISSTEVNIVFSENINQVSGQTLLNYKLNNGIGNPVLALLDIDNSTIHLTFNTLLTNGVTYQLICNNIEDLSSNILLADTINFHYFIPSHNDIVITEIHADPDISTNLPNAEFVELYNRTVFDINLENYQLTDASSTKSILSAYTLPANEYVIITKNTDVFSFSFTDKVLGANSFPSLNNSGDNLMLTNANGDILDQVSYSDDWYADILKKDGGWSLEIVDPNTLCGEEKNWKASEDESGGTPGRINSINANNPDLTSPKLTEVFALKKDTVKVVFNEILDNNSINISDFTINNNITISSFVIESDKKTIQLILDEYLQPQALYTLNIDNITDCAGNRIITPNSIQFTLPEPPQIGDIVVNEILFNPQSGGNDFVEVYNNSSKFIDLSLFHFIEFDNDEDSVNGVRNFTRNPSILAPNNYAWLTENFENISLFYPKAVKGNVILSDLPTYSNSEGIVAIGYFENDSLIVADKFHYLEEYHYELLEDRKGVSLERIRFDGNTNEVNNWHSSSSTENYATPGYENSQQLNIDKLESKVTIVPEIFTPNNDGVDDFTTFNYNFDDNGYTLNITIFDSYGRLVKNLVQNELVGLEGFYQWNGINNQGRKSNVGYHIALIEIFDLQGNKNRFKKKLIVGTQF